nr:immunoglobulin mu heavy chain [Bos taurus]
MSDKAVGWVRRAPGKALEWLGSIDTGGSTGYNPGLKSRLSITKDNSKSQVSLSVSSATTEDSATYYCTTVHQETKKTCPEGWGCENDRGWGHRCPSGDCCRWTGTQWIGGSYTYTYKWHVHTWGQGFLVTVSSEGESHPR